MSYDLQIVAPVAEERARALFEDAGAEPAGDELLLERDGVVATILVAGGEVGIGITTLGGDAGAPTGFRAVLDIVLGVAGTLGAAVYDPQVGRELGPGDAEEAVHAFG